MRYNGLLPNHSNDDHGTSFVWDSLLRDYVACRMPDDNNNMKCDSRSNCRCCIFGVLFGTNLQKWSASRGKIGKVPYRYCEHLNLVDGRTFVRQTAVSYRSPLLVVNFCPYSVSFVTTSTVTCLCVRHFCLKALTVYLENSLLKAISTVARISARTRDDETLIPFGSSLCYCEKKRKETTFHNQ